MTTKTSKGDGRNQQSALTGPRKKAKGGKKGRKPVAPVKVGKDRNWGPIVMFAAVGVIVVAIVGYAFWAQRDTQALSWQERAAQIEGLVNYREQNPAITTDEFTQHQPGNLEYETTPPAYGNHNGTWQNCQGRVYDQQIPSEHAVHSLEHGTVWITYNPDTLPQAEVDELAGKVEGNDKMMMSPFPGQDSPISLQAWGYQLKVDSAGDSRIDEFVRALRVNTSLEGPNARCDSGVTATGDTPLNVGNQMDG